MAAPLRAAWAIALASAWTVLMQWPSTISWPTSSQCGKPRGAPLYPVERITLLLVITAPTWARSQVEREPTISAILRKYSSQVGRLDISFFFIWTENALFIERGQAFQADAP